MRNNFSGLKRDTRGLEGRAIASSRADKFQQIVVIPAGVEAFAFDAGFDARVPLEQIERDSAQAREVLRAVALSNPTAIFVEAHVQLPVEIIFPPPVSAGLPADSPAA